MNYFLKKLSNVNNIKYLKQLYPVTQSAISEKTGIAQSRISRIENGSEIKQGEAVVLAEFFGISVDMLLSTDLTSKYQTKDQIEEWKRQEENKKKEQTNYFQSVSQAPLWIEVLKNHYIKTISEITSKKEEQIREELNAQFEALINARSKTL